MAKRSSIVRGIKASGIEIAEVRIPEDAQTQRLTLDEIEVLFVLSGELALVSDDATRFKAGIVLLRRLDVNVPMRAVCDTHILSVRVPITYRGADPDRLSSVPVWSRVPRAASDDFRRLHLALSNGDSELVLEALAMLLIGWGERVIQNPSTRSVRPPWMRIVLERLADYEWSPSLRELSQQTGVNAAHLGRAFRGMEGCSVGEYQRKLRVATACRLMHSDSMSLAQIAAETGFVDQAHFSKVFKRHTGKTPREYRNSLVLRAEPIAPAFDPIGKYGFRSQTADGIPYDGEIEITGSVQGYGGVVRTSVMPNVAIDTVAVSGRTLVLTGSVPAGIGILHLKFDGSRFSGEWRLAGKPTAVKGWKAC